jgi:hypothetical protein
MNSHQKIHNRASTTTISFIQEEVNDNANDIHVNENLNDWLSY